MFNIPLVYIQANEEIVWVAVLSEKKDKTLKDLLDTANLDFKLFKSVSQNLLELYGNDVLRLIFAGPRTAGGLPLRNRKILMKKHQMDEKKLSEVVLAFLRCVHYELRKASNKMYNRLKEKKDVKTAEMFREKISLIGEILKKYPDIKQGYLTYTFTKLYYFEDLDWEAELKVFQSASEFLPEDEVPPVFPSARLRLLLKTPDISPVEPRTKSFEFEISKKDLNFVIKSLQDLREALINIEKKKLVD